VGIVTRSYIVAFCDIYTGMVTVHVAVLQDCLQLLPWFMNNGQLPFLLYASRIFPDKKMQSTEKRKLSLGIFLCLMAEYSVICDQSCVGNMTHNVYA
jgi:hypothetical protein